MHKFLFSLEACFSVGGLRLFSLILCCCNLETQTLKIFSGDNQILPFFFQFRFFLPLFIWFCGPVPCTSLHNLKKTSLLYFFVEDQKWI